MGKIKVTVWNEFHDEKRHPAILELYPGGVHEAIARFLKPEDDFKVRTNTYYSGEDQGLGDAILDDTDVLIFYSHMLQNHISEDRIKKIIDRVVIDGMGAIFLHSSLGCNVYQRLVGPSGRGTYREIEEKERVWVIDRSHPIADGLKEFFEIPQSEMYGEPNDIPIPDELIFISWYQGGEVLRSGYTYRRGAGKVFYFAPGHAWYNTMHLDEFKLVIKNAVRWAKPLSNKPVARRFGKVDPLEDIE